MIEEKKRVDSNPKIRILSGLVIGMCAWWFVVLALTYTDFYNHFARFQWLEDGAPVYIGAVVAGYIVRRRGLIWGCIVGVFQQVFYYYGLILRIIDAAQKVGFAPVMDQVKEMGWIPSVLGGTAVVLVIGAVGGYLGERLARIRRCRSKPSDQISQRFD